MRVIAVRVRARCELPNPNRAHKGPLPVVRMSHVSSGCLTKDGPKQWGLVDTHQTQFQHLAAAAAAHQIGPDSAAGPQPSLHYSRSF